MEITRDYRRRSSGDHGVRKERDPDENWVDCNKTQARADGDYKLLQARFLSRRLLESTGGWLLRSNLRRELYGNRV